jgi:hypothetical protein
MVEGLILLHLLSGVDEDVITVRSLRKVIVCKIMAQPPAVPCGDGMKDKNHGESCNLLLPEREPEHRVDGLDESARFTPLNNFFILHNTCNNNTQQEVPNTLGVSVSNSRTGGRKQKVV